MCVLIAKLYLYHENVAKTIGFTTFAKLIDLWLERRGATELQTAATPSRFSQMLIFRMF